MDNSHSGRKRHIGFAPEATRGTAAAAAMFWIRNSSMGFYDRQDVIDNESSMGIDERVNDSELAGEFSDGPVEGKITADSFGVILTGMFGQPDSSPVEGGGHRHVFRFSDTIGSLTAFRKTKVNDLKFARCTLSSLEMRAAAKDWSTFSAEMTAMKGTGTSSTPAYIDNEPEFSGKNVTVRAGLNEAAMLAASRLSASTANATISREVSPYWGLGNEQPDDIDATEITVEGELTTRYKDLTLENYARQNQKIWLQIMHENAAVDLGGGNHPSLTITYPKASLRSPDLSDDLAAFVNQTFSVVGEYNTTEGYSIEVVLVNSTPSYAAV